MIFVVRDENAEAVGVFVRHRLHADGHRCLVLAVELDQRAVIHCVDVVAGKNEYFGELLRLDVPEVVVDRVCRAAIPVRARAPKIGLQDLHAPTGAVEVPGLADTDVVIERVRAVLC